MVDILSTINTRNTPQSKRADVRQVKNRAGGYVFEVTPLERLRRFLTIGTDAGTFYVSPAELTAENAQVVLDMARTDHTTLLATLLDVSERGAAPRQNPVLFALAIACSNGTDDERRAALAALPRVARTGTHLFLFARYIEQFRGWGRGLRRAVGSWYTDRDVDALAYQVVKYQSRR